MADIIEQLKMLESKIHDLEMAVKKQHDDFKVLDKNQLSYPLDLTTTSLVNSAIQKLIDNNLGIQKGTYFVKEVDNGDSGTAITIDWTQGNKQKLTLTDNCTIGFKNPSGACNLILKAVNFGAFTPTFSTVPEYPSGAAPTWTAAGTDIMSLYFDGKSPTPTYYAVVSNNFS